MIFERTRDYAAIRSIVTLPVNWRAATDDFAPLLSEYEVNRDERILYVFAYAHAELLGLFTFYPQGGVTYDVHVSMLPSAYGERARRAAREVFPWLFARTGIQRFTASIPVGNRLAIALAKQAGFTQWGTNKKALLRRGKLTDLLCFGLSREDLQKCE